MWLGCVLALAAVLMAEIGGVSVTTILAGASVLPVYLIPVVVYYVKRVLGYCCGSRKVAAIEEAASEPAPPSPTAKWNSVSPAPAPVAEAEQDKGNEEAEPETVNKAEKQFTNEELYAKALAEVDAPRLAAQALKRKLAVRGAKVQALWTSVMAGALVVNEFYGRIAGSVSQIAGSS